MQIDIHAVTDSSLLSIMPLTRAGVDWMAEYVGERADGTADKPIYYAEHRYGPDILLGAHHDGLTVSLNGRVADAAREA